ncbi:MAG: sigma-70 factor domain-containing protein, partial [Chloroflexota bacterium]
MIDFVEQSTQESNDEATLEDNHAEEEDVENVEAPVEEGSLQPGAPAVPDELKPTLALEEHEITDDSVRMYLKEIGQVPLLD